VRVSIAAVSLERLQAERDIERLVHNYGAAVDRRDFDGIMACYWDDAWEDHSPGYCGPVSGYIEWLRQVMQPGPLLTHQFGNIRVDVADEGESARLDSYCFSTVTFPAPDGSMGGWMQSGLHYVDDVSRPQGAWRFQQRRCRALWRIENGVAQTIPPTG
jgi:hypothetical protein